MSEISYNDNLVKEFEHYKPMPASQKTVDVDVTPSQMMEVLATETEAESFRLAPYEGYPALKNLSAEKIMNYFRTLIYLRTCYCIDDTSRVKQYKSLTRKLCIPVLFYQILISVGVVCDRVQGIRFKPSYSIDKKHLLGAADLQSVSDDLSRMNDLGLVCVYGMPKEKDGVLGFMAMSCIDGDVYSYREDHPVHAFLAAFIEKQKWEEVLGMKLYVKYGSIASFECQIMAVIRALQKPTRAEVSKPKG